MRAITTIRLFTVVGSLLLQACLAPPEDEAVTTSLSGLIFDGKTNKPIAGAIVATEPATEQVKTDKNGKFRISTNITIGKTYRITASVAGYATNTASVEAREGENKLADIALEKTAALSVNKTTLEFGATEKNQTLILKNESAGSLAYTLIVPKEDWLKVGGKLSGTIGAQATTISISVDRTGLTEGSYNAELVITSIAGEETVSISVDVLPPNTPKLSLDTQHIEFDEGEVERAIKVKNIGTGDLDLHITVVGDGLQVDKLSGVLKPGSLLELHVAIADDFEGPGAVTFKGPDKTVRISVTRKKNPENDVVGNADLSDVDDEDPFDDAETDDDNLPAPKHEPHVELNDGVEIALTPPPNEEGEVKLLSAAYVAWEDRIYMLFDTVRNLDDGKEYRKLLSIDGDLAAGGDPSADAILIEATGQNVSHSQILGKLSDGRFVFYRNDSIAGVAFFDATGNFEQRVASGFIDMADDGIAKGLEARGVVLLFQSNNTYQVAEIARVRCPLDNVEDGFFQNCTKAPKSNPEVTLSADPWFPSEVWESGTFLKEAIYAYDVKTSTSSMKIHKYNSNLVFQKSYTISPLLLSRSELERSKLIASQDALYLVSVADLKVTFRALKLVD